MRRIKLLNVSQTRFSYYGRMQQSSILPMREANARVHTVQKPSTSTSNVFEALKLGGFLSPTCDFD